MCFETTFSNVTGKFFRYRNCNESAPPQERLIVHFAVLNDNHFNSSFLTWSSDYNTRLFEELKAHGFEKFENTDDPNQQRTWYRSPRFEHMNLMWEKLTDQNNVKRWHIGLVWE